MDQDLKPLHGIYLLLMKVYPQPQKSDLNTIINLNQGEMKKYLENFINNEFFELTNERSLEKLNESDKDWQKPSTENIKRENFLTKLFTFSEPEHIEMLNLDKIRELVPIKRIKLALSKSSFINFSIKEKMKNMHLSLQGLYLQIFLNYHMKHDLKFKAKVDSMQIEMDNPYARQQIRDENRKDDIIGKRYLQEMEVDEWCKHLLENFFPNIAGIWADHFHVTHVLVLAIIRFCYECGFIDIEDTEDIIKLLYRACTSLLKLEEAWIERLSHITKISDRLRADNVTKHFAKCREHIAAILVQILTLYQDNYFIKNFPMNAKKDSGKLENFMKDMTLGNYPFFNESQNNIILFITMNYLSLTVEIESLKGTNDFTKQAVEKIFLYITTENKDCFIESIKQVTAEDLKYFTEKDAICQEFRDVSDSMGYSMRTLLEFIGMGCFDQASLKMIKNIENHKNYEKYLSHYVSKDATLKTVISKMTSDIKKDISNIDFRVALVKESIPLMLLALADYITEYFHSSKERKELIRDIFDLLYEISVDNNNCKGQIFKGDGLFHLRKLVQKQNKYAFFFLNKLCETSNNISIFLGRGFFAEIVTVFKDFQKRVIEDIELASKEMRDGDNNKKLNKDIDIDDWSLYIILNNLFTKMLNRKFLSEREKIQTSLQIQEAIYPSLTSTLMNKFIGYLKSQSEKSNQSDELRLKKDIFREGEESKMVQILEKREDDETLTYVDLGIIGYQLCFSSLRAFNTACSNVFSNEVYNCILPYTDQLKDYLFLSSLDDKKDTDPFGLDTEIIKLLRNMTLIPESNIMIERNFDMNHDDNQVFDADSTALEDIKNYLKRCVDYSKQLDLREEGQKFVMEGVLPLIYKYMTSLLNLTHFELKVKGINPYETEEERKNKKVDINDIKFNLKIAIEVYDIYKENNQALINLMDRNITNTLFSNHGDENTELFDEKKENKKGISNDQLLKYTNRLITYCQKVIKDIEKFYSGSRYAEDLNQFKEMDKEEFEASASKASFQGETEDQEIQKKMDRLNYFIQSFQHAKKQYLERPEEPNLIAFFDKNTDNLFGVFSSCIDRLYGLTKAERFSKVKKLARDTGTNRFWMSQSCYAYIQMLEKLISQSEKGREEFFNFINDKEEEPENEVSIIAEESAENVERNELIEGVGRRVKVKEGGRKSQTLTNKNQRERLIGMLQRVQHDLVLFLTTSPTQKPIWWNVSLIYEMLCSFFKNLCENNYLKFKDYLGEHIPLTEDEEWNFERKTCTEIFTDQLQYLLGSSKLAENRENYMVHSDQHKRIQPLFQPLINVLNELVTGPCKINQKIVCSQPIIEIFQLMSRIIDQLDDDYIELKHSALILILSLSEGFDPDIINEISVRATPSILLNQIHRITKKIYVSELIRLGKFKEEVIQRNREKEREIMLRKKKKGKIDPANQAKSNNKVNPDPGIHKSNTLGEKEIKEKTFSEFMVNQKMENSVTIKNWTVLRTLYMQYPQFSEGLLFDFAFRMVILWQMLAKYNKKHSSRLKEIMDESKNFFEKGKLDNSSEYQREISSIFYFISKITLNVEVVDSNSNHVLVYFPRKPDCFLLADEDKKNYVENCDITDSNTKMLDLMRNFNIFSLQMKDNIKSYRTMPMLYRLTSKDAFANYNKIAWTIGFLINILMAWVIVRNGHKDLRPDSDSHKLYYNILCWILIAFSAFCFVLWMTFRYGQKRRIKKEEFKFENPQENPDSLKNMLIISIKSSILESSVAMSFILYLFFTLYGVLGQSYTLITFNLFLFVNISRNAKFVMNSITLHAGPLLLTLLMALFVIFTYTILLAEFYYGTLDIENLEEMNICSNLYTCFWFTMNWGLRNGGGIADSMIVEPKGTTFFGKNLYDVSFFIVVNVIALNIIFGMIIDTFGQLREEEGERQTDAKNVCFVCGNERSDFGKKNKNFEDHVKVEHDPWNYIYYVFYMKAKGEDELSGLEYHAWSCFEGLSTEWIPIGDTHYLEAEEEEEEGSIGAIQQQIKDMQAGMDDLAKDVVKNFSFMKKMMKEIYSKMRDSNHDLRRLSKLQNFDTGMISGRDNQNHEGGTGGRNINFGKRQKSIESDLEQL